MQVYPFSAIVGQETVKTALIMNAVDPTIGGVLISGPKGSGKSLLVKAFSQVLPDINYVTDCSFKCNPSDPTNMCSQCLAKFEVGNELAIDKKPMKIVQVPLSVTDDMLIGSIDLDRALEQGMKALHPGLLAEANQNILYIDEVNLLPDHITDSILDAAASGWNTVEREGVSVQHPSRFILVGTMNPEEGELRPQILDRFGIFAETDNLNDIEQRTLVLERNEKFNQDPSNFITKFEEDLKNLRSKIELAKKRLPTVKIPDDVYTIVAETCSKLKVDGFRPDIVAMKVAKALLAYQGKEEISREDIIFSLELSLGHRTRISGMAPPPTKAEIQKAFVQAKRRTIRLSSTDTMSRFREIFEISRESFELLLRTALKSFLIDVLIFGILLVSFTYFLDVLRQFLGLSVRTTVIFILEVMVGGLLSTLFINLTRRGQQDEIISMGFLDLSDMTVEAAGNLARFDMGGTTGKGAGSPKVIYDKEDPAPEIGKKILQPIEILTRGLRGGGKPRRLDSSKKSGGFSGGRREKATSSTSRGRYAWYRTPKGKPSDIAIVPTLKAAAVRQRKGESGNFRLNVKPEDLKEKIREYRNPYSIILLVDMSLSMIESVSNIAQAIYNLHQDVYRRRDRVGLIVFKGSKAYTLQQPTANLDLVVSKLRKAGASDFTPLAPGLFQAWKVIKQEKLRNKNSIPHLIVVSDGIANVSLSTPLSPLTRRKYMSEAQSDSLDIARLLAKEGIKVHIVNTNHIEDEMVTFPKMVEGWRIKLTPTQFLTELARLSKGSYQGLMLKGDI